ncbi:MAG: RpoL/Rpb11 RNA polymerase subunit family protein, partial [Candidatus Aenigmatarchaeota archaeon]
IVEKKEGKIKVEVIGEDHTFLNVLREKCWKAGASQASYMIEHPCMSNPKIIVSAKNPKKVLSDAADMIIDDVSEFRKGFSKAIKR